MKVIIDTNLWISYLISEKLNGLKHLCLDRYFSIFYCDEIIEEFVRVSNKPKIKKHGIEERHISAVVNLIRTHCIKAEIKNVSGYAVRDPKDIYLLVLADVVNADFLLTGDKDLLILKLHNQTKIISYSKFMVKYKSLLWRIKRFIIKYLRIF
ncbi:MAG: putative toxin-antitoxin system toxin component, PIN family [Fibromonadales bacterium]|nr:putative toxin-antitoxin system toxin component, PIN family [Fibromonadales bacterium]